MTIAKEIALLATEVDSLEKALVQAQAERARELKRRERAEADAQQLRLQLRHARERANAAERELANATAKIEAARDSAKQSDEAKKVLRHEVEQIERERRALELNLREVLANLRQAGQRAEGSQAAPRTAPDEATLVQSRPSDNGW
jgi:chromosome segregation ATPase